MACGNKPHDYNVFIFNNIKNNEQDIKLLTETFESLECSVKLNQSLTLEQYEQEIQENMACGNKPHDYNVFIFNNIKNNEQDIKLLTETFESLECSVKLNQSLTLEQYEQEIQEICNGDFGVYDYIAVIVLDNKNSFSHLITTSDGHELRINNDLLVRILQNKTLANKKRLFVIQTNQICSDDPEPSKTYYIDEEKKEKIKIYLGTTISLYATGKEYKLEDYWSVPNAPPSPFIESFCRNLTKDSKQEKTILYIYDQICLDLDKEEFIPEITHDPVIFGRALTDNKIADNSTRTSIDSNGDNNK